MSMDICSMAQNMPEFLDIVSELELRVRKFPWAVQMIAAPSPSKTLPK